MAAWPNPESDADQDRPDAEAVSGLPFKVQSIGRSLPRTGTPEGWVKKVDRSREGKVWVGYFHVWETRPNGGRVRRKKEKTLGPATKPKHEALKDLADYIAEQTGKLSMEKTQGEMQLR